ncbi:glycosyltransferase [Nisaea denitrificans]|uniref:glycosyltransferase n=1 Tax=Nisaea denitrificans TaxID=390877 RepID=UPI000683E3CD|nr:glycosyltransferase [Nisaea denitrificans]
MTKRPAETRDLREIGRDLFGPLVNLYLLKLHAHLLQTDPRRDRILFGLRAGLRIRSLYGIWLERRGSSLPDHAVLFKTSRLMAVKAAFKAVPDLALTALARELDGESLDSIVRALLRAEVPSSELKRDNPPIQQQPLHEFLRRDIPEARRVRRHLRQQADLFADYLDAVSGPAERLVLVDTGWRGTQQLLLERTFPKRDWAGVYFGCIGRADILGVKPQEMSGLLFDSPDIDPDNPASTLILHRHLIENLFEPSFPSVEHLDRSDIKAAKHGTTVKSPVRELPDPAYEGVIDHIEAHASDSPREIATAYAMAMTRLPDMIAAPTPADLEQLTLKPRSLDLGRTGSVSVLLPARDRYPGDSPQQRVEEALWGPGQATIEFDGERRQRAQRALQAEVTRSPRPDEPSVAIITRTKDRPILLERAARSVAGQTYRNIRWVVVNDGGDPKPVGDVLERSLVDPGRIVFRSHPESLGMEAASNAGIRTSISDLIVIHDDDDSWEPDFLEQSVNFLNRHQGLYDGVVCHSTHVEEIISGNTVLECGHRPFNNWLHNVQTAEMAAGNVFPPISFLFRRALWERLDGFDETLPVLGDWDFNLRFLMEADIGVLPLPLANYHHRSDEGEDTDGSYANSDSGRENPHVAFNAILRNRYLRRAAREPQFATLAGLMGQAYGLGDLRSRLQTVPATPSAALDEADAGILKKRCAAQQQELDRRWVLLQMTVTEIIRTRGLSIEAGDLIRQISSLADEYVQSTVIQPPPDFDETAYRMENPDIARAIAEGRFKTAFDHFTKFGRHQGRQRPHAEPADQQRMPADD